jgi:hypothetical protein
VLLEPSWCGEFTKQSMEFFLALLVTALQACGSPLLQVDVGFRFKEDEALQGGGVRVTVRAGNGGVLTIDNRIRKSHHFLDALMIGRNNWSVEAWQH